MFPKKLGISVYVGKKPLEEDLAYISLARKYGFSRIFTCFMFINEDTDEFFKKVKTVAAHAVKLGFEVFTDVNPTLLKTLGASYDNLKIFEDLGITGIRLDEGNSGFEESLISYSGNLKVEINASNTAKLLDNIVSYQPCLTNILACHNFYPRRYTGLSEETFMNTSAAVKKHGIRLAAFVSSQEPNTFFSQDFMEKLPTLEHHRDLPIIAQAKELFYCGLIDDVIISNAYASEKDLKSLSQLNKDIITLDVELAKGVDDFSKEIIMDNLHINRGDTSAFMLRSTLTRVKYKNESIPPFNTVDIKRGDITIDNDNYDKYKGELHVALLPMKNYGNVNVVGRVAENDMRLLQYIKPWSKFKCKI
ncbi:MAG: MupG family TIM beta-alpha barrel fold protein [Alphaproteobacteria bacterium]|nr:MupG family TIM beta-alpha barrel fold protein [Alphaproteobacteria bacterium]